MENAATAVGVAAVAKIATLCDASVMGVRLLGDSDDLSSVGYGRCVKISLAHKQYYLIMVDNVCSDKGYKADVCVLVFISAVIYLEKLSAGHNP